MLKLTPTRIREFQNCPLQYKLKYIDSLGPKGVEYTPAFSFGSSIHAALEEIHRPNRSTAGPIDPDMLLLRHWQKEGYADIAQAEKYFEEGVNILSTYCKTMLVPQGKILGVEVFLSRVVTLNGHRFELGGKADRIELLHDGSLEILDYKTNGNGEVLPSELLINDLPTYVYYILARLSYPDYQHVIVSQLNVRTLQKSIIEYTETAKKINKDGISNLVNEIEAGNFEARPNSSCTWCSVRKHCPCNKPETDLDEISL